MVSLGDLIMAGQFQVISKKDYGNPHPSLKILQAIIYHNGSVDIGGDVWRLLSQLDFPTEQTFHYQTIKQVQENYFILDNHGCIIEDEFLV